MGTGEEQVATESPICPCASVLDEDCRVLFELAPEAMLLARGGEWSLVEANRACRELFLFDTDAPLAPGSALADLFAHGQAGLQKLLDRLEGKDFVPIHEAELRDHFGLTFPATLSARRITCGGEPHLLASVRDVSETKRTEARMRFFWSMVESSIDAIVAWSGGEAIVYANPSSRDLFGFSAGELLGRPMRELTEDPAAGEAIIRETANHGNWQGELRLRRADGSVFDAYISTWKQPDGAGGLPITVCFLRDTTERKRAEQAVQASEEKYRELVQNANSIILRMDPDGNVTFLNEFAQHFFGYAEEEILGRNVVGTIVPSTDSQGSDLNATIKEIGRHPERYAAAEDENVRRNGERVWIAWTNKPIYAADGRLTEVLCVGSDITELKRAEKKLRRSEERHRTLVEAVPDIIAELDADKNYVWLNKPGLEFFGHDALGRNATDFMIGEATRTETLEAIRPLFDGTADTVHVDSLQRRCDGAERLLAWTCKPLRNVADQVTGVLSTARDITEMKRMHAELERYSHDLETLVAERTHEVHLLSRIITSTITAWVISDPAGHLMRWNHAFEDLVRYRMEDLVGMCWADLLPDEQHEMEQALVEASLAGHGHQVIEQEICRSDGTHLPVEASFDALDVGEAEPVVFRIVTDISLRKETERRLIEARRNAEEASRLKSEFLASISHELRTPLNGILGLANTLVRLRRQAQDGQTDDFLSRIIKSGRHLQNLITEVLDISRIEAGRLALTIEAVDPAEVFQAAENQFLAAFEERNLTPAFTVAKGTPPALADKTRLTQILVNLLSNAVKFTDPGGSISTSAEPAEDGTLVEFCVSDTGRGIPADKLEQVFGRFEQLDRSGSRLGVGLGLAICRQLVEAQGGRIWAESELGVGSRFHFALPACTSTITNEPIAREAAEVQ